MNTTVFRAGIALCALTFVFATGKVSAADSNNDFELPTDLLSQQIAFNDVGAADINSLVRIEAEPKSTYKVSKPKPVKYKVKTGDNLTSIAKKNKTTWERIYFKNTDLEHPDVIIVDSELMIPAPDEKLKKRDVPATTSLAPSRVNQAESSRERTILSSSRQSSRSQVSTRQNHTRNAAVSYRRGPVSGNSYIRGYCTWYVKNRRPDLPNNLGNANTWVARARAQGLPTGSTPRVGAVGQQGMHVVYVEKVHGNGMVTVSEMNFRGWNVVSSRTVPASSFQYIY